QVIRDGLPQLSQAANRGPAALGGRELGAPRRNQVEARRALGQIDGIGPLDREKPSGVEQGSMRRGQDAVAVIVQEGTGASRAALGGGQEPGQAAANKQLGQEEWTGHGISLLSKASVG